MLTCTRRFEWDAAHRVLGHEGKCRHLHGHRYVAEVAVSANQLNKLGMVIDFSVLKTVVGTWIDEMWDHNILLNEEDPILNIANEDPTPRTNERIFNGKNPFKMTGNPTAENIAESLFNKAEHLLHDHGIRVVHVRVWETPNCYADYDRLTGRTYFDPVKQPAN